MVHTLPMPSVPFSDRGEPLEAFADRFLVRCPRCGSCAVVVTEPNSEHYPFFWPRRLTCSQCGLWRRWESRSVTIDGGPTDGYFHLPPWLQTPCVGETLWAFNEAHLQFIDGFVRARHRERVPNVNRSAASRLPRWIKSAKHRDAVLHGIERLRAQLRLC